MSDAHEFARLREQLRYWPYTIHQIEDTLNIGLIEGRGRQLLFQAINSRNLTAFVGSGLSASFGRLTWSDWQEAQFDVVRESSLAFLRLAEAALPLLNAYIALSGPNVGTTIPAGLQGARTAFLGLEHTLEDTVFQKQRYNVWGWLTYREKQLRHAQYQVKELDEAFSRADSSVGDFPGGEELPMKFQIAQQLHDQLRAHIQIFLPPPEQTEKHEITNRKCWPGARIDPESAAPDVSLDWFHRFIESLGPTALDDLRQTFDPALEAYIRVFHRTQTRVSAETLTKMFLFDERAHAMITLGRGLSPKINKRVLFEEGRDKLHALEHKLGIYSEEALKRGVEGLRDNPGLYRILGAFRFGTLKKIKSKIAKGDTKRNDRWQEFMAWETKRLARYLDRVSRAGSKREYLTPSSRFLTATYLALLDAPLEAIGPIGDDPKDKQDWLLPPLDRRSFTSRRSLIANRLDPLAKTVRRLGINRYITTNYDLEIERYFQDMGYRKFESEARRRDPDTPLSPPPDDEYRSDPTGGVLLDQTFDRTRASELVAFSVGENGKDASVFHLHGRATKKDRLVITEHDYMDLYLREDESRDSVNEAITMAFSSAPLVFLGLGMSEADLLRPLRQFMSNRDRTMGYQAVAILPGEKPVEARTKFAVTCFLRYGVHTIFYGSGMLKVQGEKDDIYLDWLARILELLRTVMGELSHFEAGKGAQTPTQLMKTFREKVGVFEAPGEDGARNLDALSALFGQLADSGSLTDEDHKALANGVMYGGLELQTCDFVPARIDGKVVQSRHHDMNVAIGGDDYVGFPTGLLTQSLRIFLRLNEKGYTPDDVAQDLAALRITLEGLNGSFLTGALNAQLIGLEREWRSWWENWQQSPPHRLARFQHLPMPDQPENLSYFRPGRFVRHRVDSIITNTERLERDVAQGPPLERLDPSGPKKEASAFKDGATTGIRAFDTFIQAIFDDLSVDDLRPEKRLLLTVAAYRGLGKGTFLSAISSSFGLSTYHQVTWGRCKRPGPKPFLVAATFINLSFSTEIASCFDSLARALREISATLLAAESDLLSERAVQEVRADLENSVNPVKKGVARPYHFRAEGSEAEAQHKALEQEYAGVSRLEELRLSCARFGEISERISRVSPDLGRPRFLVYLSGIELVYDQSGGPKNPEIERFFHAIFSLETDKVPMDFVFIGSEQKLGAPFSVRNYCKETRPFVYERINRSGLSHRALEQIKERDRNGRICSAEVANKTPPDGAPKHFVHFARPASPTSLLVDNFPLLAMALYLQRPPETEGQTEADAMYIKLKKRFEEAVLTGRFAAEAALEKSWSNERPPNAHRLDQARQLIWQQARESCGQNLADAEMARLSEKPRNAEIETLLEHRLKLENNVDRQDWRRIRHQLGSNRFTLTLLMSAAEFIVVQSESAMDGARQAEEFIHSTVDQVRNVGRDRREELILQIVLERYRRHHEIANADLDTELHLLILRHLAVIGSPTSSTVLVRLPEIRNYFQRIGTEVDVSRRRFLSRALNVLAYRGLVFRIDPHPRIVSLVEQGKMVEEETWPASQDFRYALHRTVQSFAVAKTGVGKVDPVRQNSFAPRLYASMPSVGSGLSFESYQFIRSLLIGLSQYPDVQRDDTGLMPWLFSSKDHTIKVQALRAALSLARSCLSIATLSRFPAHSDRQQVGTSRLGLLENYKIRLRWIIRMAWELVPPEQIGGASRNPAGEFPHINPLYRDEIVWTYNELGITSLAQGNLNEALGFLRQAAEFNELIEGSARNGPIYDYIDLNHAVVQMERGRLESAEMRLKRIVGKYEADTGLHSIAKGYLCVISHIRGQFDNLDANFRDVIKALQTKKDDRASAIFMAHQARFATSQAGNQALEILRNARAVAETSGHEDIRHHIEISTLTVEYRMRLGGEELPGRTNKTALQQLRDIELYGRRMGIWNLQVDALKLRAEILMSEGETSSAGMLLVRAMAIAKRYRMVLRLNATITVYADLLYLRGDLEGASRHAALSLNMAKGIGYSVQTAAAQRILSKINPIYT